MAVSHKFFKINRDKKTHKKTMKGGSKKNIESNNSFNGTNKEYLQYLKDTYGLRNNRSIFRKLGNALRKDSGNSETRKTNYIKQKMENLRQELSKPKLPIDAPDSDTFDALYNKDVFTYLTNPNNPKNLGKTPKILTLSDYLSHLRNYHGIYNNTPFKDKYLRGDITHLTDPTESLRKSAVINKKIKDYLKTEGIEDYLTKEDIYLSAIPFKQVEQWKGPSNFAEAELRKKLDNIYTEYEKTQNILNNITLKTPGSNSKYTNHELHNLNEYTKQFTLKNKYLKQLEALTPKIEKIYGHNITYKDFFPEEVKVVKSRNLQKQLNLGTPSSGLPNRTRPPSISSGNRYNTARPHMSYSSTDGPPSPTSSSTNSGYSTYSRTRTSTTTAPKVKGPNHPTQKPKSPSSRHSLA